MMKTSTLPKNCKQVLLKTVIVSLILCFNLSRSKAALIITAPSLSITECSWNSPYYLLGDVVINENSNASNGAFAVGTNVTLTLNAPAGFQFNTGALVTVSYTLSRDITAATVVVNSASLITVTYTVATASKIDKMTISGIEVLATTAATGNITSGGTGTITGCAAGTTLGSLSSTVQASAVAINDAPNGLNLCAGTPTLIGSISIAEVTCPTDFGIGAGKTLILTAPAGYSFSAGVGTVSAPSGDITATAISVAATTITVTLTVASNTNFDFLTIDGIKVTATAGAAAGSILRLAGAAGGTAVITGDAAGAGAAFTHGDLSTFVSASSITVATGGNCIPIAPTAFGSALGAISIAEQCPGDFTAGTNVTFTIIAPANYEFQTSGVTASYTAGRNITAMTVTSITAGSGGIITITMTIAAGADKLDDFTISGIRVRATVATAASNLTRGGTALITGCPNGTLLGSVFGSASSGTVTWVGGTGGNTTTWTTASNWNPATVPGICSDVVIPVTANSPILAGATSVNSLTINSGATFTANAALTINSYFTNNGTYNHANTGNASTTIFAGTETFSSTSNIVVTAWYDANAPLAKYISGNLGNVTLSYTAVPWDQDGEFSNHQIQGNLLVTTGTINMDDGTGASTALTIGGTVTTSGSGTIVFRKGAAPAGGNFTLNTGSLTHGSTAYMYGVYQCAANLLWTVNGNVLISGAGGFAATYGSSTATITTNLNISGNLTINAGAFDINKFAYNAGNATVTVGGTSTFADATGSIVFVDGGTGSLNFTTQNLIISKASTSPYVSLMRTRSLGNPAPTGSVTVHVTNDFTFPNGNAAVAYLIYNTANTSTCALTVDHDFVFQNSTVSGSGLTALVSEFFIANHKGALNITIGHDFRHLDGAAGYYSIIGQYNTAATGNVTMTVANDFFSGGAATSVVASTSDFASTADGAAAGNAAFMGVNGAANPTAFTLTVGRNYNITNGYFYGIYRGDGDFTLNVTGQIFMGSQSYVRFLYNNGDYTAGRILVTAGSVWYRGGGFIGQYGCQGTTGTRSSFAVTGNMDLWLNPNGLATQFWVVGLATLGTTTNKNGLDMSVGGTWTISGDQTNSFTSSNALGTETVDINGDFIIKGGINTFNVAQNSGVTTGHAVTMDIAGTLSLVAHAGGGTTGSQTFLSAETGALTATIGAISITAPDATPFAILSLKGDDGVGTINVTGGYTQSGANSQFILHDNPTDAGAATDVVTLTINSDDDATGDFSQTAGQINFDNNVTTTAMPVHFLYVKSPNYTLGGTGIINRNADPGTSNVSTGTNFGELYFAHAGTTVFSNTTAPSPTTHFIQGVKQFINVGTIVNASATAEAFMVASNSTLANIANTAAKWALEVNGTLNMGPQKIGGTSVSDYFSGIRVNSGGLLQTSNTAGFYDGTTNACLQPKVLLASTTNRMDFSLDANSTVEYNASVNQIVTGKYPTTITTPTGAVTDVASATAAQYHYGNLKINNGGTPGTVYEYPNTSTGTGNVFVRTQLNLLAGELYLAGSGTGQTITIENAATTGIIRTAGYIKSEEDNGGNNRAIVQWNAGATNGSYIIPFGLSNTYIPFTFSKTSGNSVLRFSTRFTANTNTNWAAASNAGAIGAVTSMNSLVLGNVNGSIPSVIDRWWDIYTVTAPVTANLTFSYRGIENTTTYAPTGIMAAQHWNGASWDAPVGSGTGVTTGVGTVSVSGASTFSPWIISTLTAPLPIELTSFTGNCESNNVVLKWTTASETNNDFFTIEKSIDGINFTEAGIIKGAGNSSSSNKYSFADYNSFNGLSYYRLKQTDYNRQSETCKTISVGNCYKDQSVINAFNNNSGNVVVDINSESAGGTYQVVMYDALGNQLYNKPVTVEKGNNNYLLDISNFNAGIYFIKIEGGKEPVTKKIFVK
jgi:hypothetical protein